MDHAYPRHVHDVWTLLIVDDGAVRFDLNRHRHGALRTSVTLLPPYVPHDGRSATSNGFRKRVLYLEAPAPGLAVRLRELLDARTVEGVTLGEAAELLHAHPTHLVRTFTRVHGLPPHSYLTGRRVELARRLLLAGQRPAEAAASAGFFDQAHLTRHFRRHLGVSPARYPGLPGRPGRHSNDAAVPPVGLRRVGRR
ncbi:AraC family transcriptional regulator [Micromonospora arborensis]|uniref:helix-turn-helix transcriptional regulator n=1 Tax=Micromonospora arborensis TaxID=2116518 RepID=UPI00343479F0